MINLNSSFGSGDTSFSVLRRRRPKVVNLKRLGRTMHSPGIKEIPQHIRLRSFDDKLIENNLNN